MTLLHKKADIKNDMPVCPHVQIVHTDITKRAEKVLDVNQPREQVGIRERLLDS